jgi:hypothetical protein
MFVTTPNGGLSPYDIIKECESGITIVTEVEERTHDGRAMFHCRITQIPPNTVDDEYTFDTSRGHLPFELIRRDGERNPDRKSKSFTIVRLLDARRMPNDHWFPMKVISVTGPEKGRVSVQILNVTEVEVDPKFEDNDFAMTIPAGTMVQTNDDGKYRAFRTKQAERVLPSQLPGIQAMLNKSAVTPRMDTALPPPPIPWYRRSWVMGLAASMVVLSTGLGLRKVIWSRRTA